MLSVANRCIVNPMDQTNTPELEFASNVASSPMRSFVTPEEFSNCSHLKDVTFSRRASKPLTCFRMKSWSNAEPGRSSSISNQCFIIPCINAMSPPIFTCNKSSAILVTNKADSGIEGTQYSSIDGSWYGLITIIFVPLRFAAYIYFVETGWLFAATDPQNTSTSVPIQSL